MKTSRISASSYSNTAPLIWPFLFGSQRGRHEVILDTAPARSVELLAKKSVDAALVPVIAYQMIEGVKLVPDVCVGAREKVRSVCLVTRGLDLDRVRSVSLDVSSKTSVVLTKLIFREYFGFEPVWKDAEPDLESMLADSDCALLIGDPALMIDEAEYRKIDLVEIWREFTGYGFVFAMWMTNNPNCDVDFASARDEGLEHLDEIISNYEGEITLSHEDFRTYLAKDISFSIDDSMQQGIELYFKLAERHKLINEFRPMIFC